MYPNTRVVILLRRVCRDIETRIYEQNAFDCDIVENVDGDDQGLDLIQRT